MTDWLEYTPTGLVALKRSKRSVEFEDYERAFKMMDQETVSLPYYRGDLVLIASLIWGEIQALSVIDDTQGTAKTWENNFNVCRRIPPEGIDVDDNLNARFLKGCPTRRRVELKFSHHAEVAYLPPEEQIGWLDYAVDNKPLSAHKLRALIQGSKPLSELIERQHDRLYSLYFDELPKEDEWNEVDDRLQTAINNLYAAVKLSKEIEKNAKAEERDTVTSTSALFEVSG